MKNNIENIADTLFLGVDLGSESFKAVLMKFEEMSNGNVTQQVLAVNRVRSEGAVERAQIVNFDKTIEIVSQMIEEITKEQEGKIYTSFALQGPTLRSKINRVSNPFSKHERIIEKRDVDIVLEMAGNAHINTDREYLHMLPKAFYVNNIRVSSDPAGQIGASIDAEVLLISVPSECIEQIVHCSESISYPCNFICATPFATGEAILTKKEKIEGVLSINLGAEMSSAAVFENGSPRAMAMLPMGGIDITRDISQVMNIPISLAEQIKINYGFVDDEYINMFNARTIRIPFNQQMYDISLEQVYEIVLARTLEIVTLLRQQLQTTNEPFPLPLVITGGSSRMLGLKQLCESVFANSVRIATPWNWGGPYDAYEDPSFSTSIGLCMAGLEHHKINYWSSIVAIGKKNSAHKSLGKSIKKVYTSISDKFRNFLSLGDIS